jgi:predicted regulator of Ras-like GTPase activity (Roadblock/LC7/MglB family)
MMAEERAILSQWDCQDEALKENALAKARGASRQAQGAAVAQDEGLVAAQFEALKVSRNERIAAAAAARAVRTAAASELQDLITEATCADPTRDTNNESVHTGQIGSKQKHF